MYFESAVLNRFSCQTRENKQNKTCMDYTLIYAKLILPKISFRLPNGLNGCRRPIVRSSPCSQYTICYSLEFSLPPKSQTGRSAEKVLSKSTRCCEICPVQLCEIFLQYTVHYIPFIRTLCLYPMCVDDDTIYLVLNFVLLFPACTYIYLVPFDLYSIVATIFRETLQIHKCT